MAPLVVGSQSFSDAKIVVMAVVVAIVALLILFPRARKLSQKGSAQLPVDTAAKAAT